MSGYQEAARPVLFEYEDDDESSYFGIGSSVLVSTARNNYWVTASHVLEKQEQDIHSLRIFPTDISRQSIPFNSFLNIEKDEDDYDYADLFIAQIDSPKFMTSSDAILTTQRIEDGLFPSSKLAKGDELFVIGFPCEHRCVDYDEFKIKYQLGRYAAIYEGEATMQHCHDISFHRDHGLSDFNGLSGSPIYKICDVGIRPRPLVVGILVRGSASSSKGYFIESDVLRYAILKSENSAV